MKHINLSVRVEDNEIFDAEIVKAIRDKISGMMRSEFDKNAADKIESMVHSRLSSDLSIVNYYSKHRTIIERVIQDTVSKSLNSKEYNNYLKEIAEAQVSKIINKDVKDYLKAIVDDAIDKKIKSFFK